MMTVYDVLNGPCMQVHAHIIIKLAIKHMGIYSAAIDTKKVEFLTCRKSAEKGKIFYTFCSFT